MEDQILDRDIAIRAGTVDLFFAKGSIIHREGDNSYILPAPKKVKLESGLKTKSQVKSVLNDSD